MVKNNGDKYKYMEQRLANLENKVETFFPKFIQFCNDVTWLKKFFWIVATASIGGLLTNILNFYISVNSK